MSYKLKKVAVSKMETATKNKAGGNRPNAGRKKGEPKKAIGKRVPIKYHSQLVKLVEIELQRLLALSRR